MAANSIPDADARLFAKDSEVSYYHKGAILLLELEDRIGQEKMEELLSFCVEQKVKTTKGFLDAIEKVTDIENRKYFTGQLSK